MGESTACMSYFAQDLFGGGRFLRWSLFSVSVVSFVLMAVTPYDWTPLSVAVFLVVETALALLALAMIAPKPVWRTGGGM